MKKEGIRPPEFEAGTPIPEGFKSEADFKITHIFGNELPRLLREVEDGGKVYEGTPLRDIQQIYEQAGEVEIAETFALVSNIAEVIKSELGGNALVVGGFVRDTIMGFQPKDVDVEVYGVAPEELEEHLAQFGRVESVGKSFGILKIITPSGVDVDVSLPRTDSKIDVGHKGFAVNIDPNMTVKEAARRRDFTFNTIAQDPVTGEIFDYFGGVEDASKRRLRVTDPELFQDDPLRVLRGVQFTSRFGLVIENDTERMMREMVPRLSEIPYDRITTEWEKLFVKSPQPSIGLQMLASLGILESLYPELDVLRQTPQEFDWHPEGNVWVHTLMVVDQAKRIAKRENLSESDTYDLLLGSLLHDVGKATTTKYEEKKGMMRFTSHGHERAGFEWASNILERFVVKKKRKEKILHMVTEHMMPGALYMHFTSQEAQESGDNPRRAIRRLRQRIGQYTTLKDIALVGEADALGRGPFPDPNNPEQFELLFSENGAWMLEKAKEFKLEQEHTPIIRGLDLLEIPEFKNLSIKDRVWFGQFIKLADRMHDTFGYDKTQILELFWSGVKVRPVEEVYAEIEATVSASESSEKEIVVEQRSFDQAEHTQEQSREMNLRGMFLGYIENKKAIRKQFGDAGLEIQTTLFGVDSERTSQKSDQERIHTIVQRAFGHLSEDVRHTITSSIQTLIDSGWTAQDVQEYIVLLNKEGKKTEEIIDDIVTLASP